MSGYGFLAGHKMALDHRAEPLAHEITLRYRAQSILARNGIVPPLPSIEDARRILARASKSSRVTVPQPLREPVMAARPSTGASTHRESGAVQATGHDQCQPVPRQRVPLLPAAAGQAGDPLLADGGICDSEQTVSRQFQPFIHTLAGRIPARNK